MQDLGSATEWYSGAYAINSSGQVAGWSWTSVNWHAALWQSNGSMQDLGALTAGGNSEAYRHQ